MRHLPANDFAAPTKLKHDRRFQPCTIETGDEAFPNGIFVFNITRLLDFIDGKPVDFPMEFIAVASIPDFGCSHLDEKTVASADFSRPVPLAEIAPGRYNLIDGHHRVERARREGVPTLPARRIYCPHHIPFLTSDKAYECYVEYWNAKVKEMQPRARKASNVDRRPEIS